MLERDHQTDIHVDIKKVLRAPFFSLKNIRIHAPSGHIVLLKGPNGSGKTSLLKCLAGLLTYEGHSNILPHQTHWISAKPPFDMNLSLRDNLAYLCALNKMPFVMNGLSGFDIQDLSSTKVKYLSHGQKQRAYLSTLLMQYRPVWLLDEPTQGLDQVGRATLLTFIKTHSLNGGVTFIASHEENFCRADLTLSFGGEI